MPQPVSHLEESLKLTADGYVDLYKLTLKGTATSVYFTPRETITWQGNTYENVNCRLEGDRMTSDGQEIRPTLTIVNPAGIFDSFLQAGTLEYSTVYRLRLLRAHLESDINIYAGRMWWVGAIPNIVSGQSFTLSLRNMTEGPNFFVPARGFYPPEFPSVTF